MRIKEMISQHRRDFVAIMECEFCGHTFKLRTGYDDDFYHKNVIPHLICDRCGQSAITGGAEVRPQATKYPEGFQI